MICWFRNLLATRGWEFSLLGIHKLQWSGNARVTDSFLLESRSKFEIDDYPRQLICYRTIVLSKVTQSLFQLCVPTLIRRPCIIRPVTNGFDLSSFQFDRSPFHEWIRSSNSVQSIFSSFFYDKICFDWKKTRLQKIWSRFNLSSSVVSIVAVHRTMQRLRFVSSDQKSLISFHVHSWDVNVTKYVYANDKTSACSTKRTKMLPQGKPVFTT